MKQKPIRLFSRAAMLLLMMMLTTASAWATDVTVTYKISVSSTLKATITNAETGKTVCSWGHGILTLWPANETHEFNDQYGISLTPNRDLDKTDKNEDGNNASTTAFKTEEPTTFSVSVPNNSQYYLKSVTFKEDDTEKASSEVAPNNKSGNVNISGHKFFNYITVELTTDKYYRLTPSSSLSITTTPARTYNNAKYYVAGTDITITPTNASCIVESVSGVNNATIAADKRSFSFAMPAGNINPSASLAEVHTISGVPNDVSISDPYTTIGSTKYYLTNQTYTLTAPTNKVFSSFTATGAASSSVAANKNSATITIGSSDVTVSATLLTIGGTCGNGLTWSMSDSDSDDTYDRLTLSGSGTLSTSPWATDFAASITRVDISSADITISGNPFSTLDSSADIVVPSPAYAVSYASADFAGKLRVQFGNYLFLATNEGGTAAYAITGQADLRHLASAINDGSEGIANGKTFRQTGNITFYNSSFMPIGLNLTKYFSGTYDGGGYTISGLHFDFSADIYTYGLFGYVKNGLVENVRLVSPSVNVNNAYSGYCCGALIGCADGASTTIRNCVVISPEINAIRSNPGAIIGAQYGCKLQNLYFYGGNCNNAIGGGYSGTDAVRARKVTLGDGIASVIPVINPTATNLDNGFVYNNDLYYREGLELTLANNLSEKTGYQITYKADGITLTDNTYTVSSADDNVTLTAVYTNNTYTVSFNGNGGTCGDGEMGDQAFTYDVAQNITANAFTRTGYTFAGWNTQADGNGTSYSDKESVSNLTTTNGGTVNLWAQWTANTYTVTLNNQSATTAGSESATATYDAAMPAITVPTKTGYTFGGYYTEENGGGTQYYNADGTSANNWIIAEDTTLYAQWTANTYTVAFNANGGTCGDGEMGDQTFTYDEAQNITANAFTRTGYTFAGWNTQADGNGTSYSDKESVNNLITTNGGTMTLYAQWTANTYTVTFEIEGGNGGSESATATYDAAMPAITVPTRTGYTFGGYYTETNGGGTQYYNADGTSAKNWNLTAATTLYAKWVVPYIDADGNTQTCSNFTVLTNSTNISDLSKGWYVVTEDVSYSSQFRCGSGDLHLILCDNAKMTVEMNNNNEAIHMGNGSLTIYAQSTGSSMGKLIATASGYSGIYVVGSVSICGGNITATGKNSNGCSGISASNSITIHSGQISASGDYGIRVNGTITLGLRNATDYITASRYNKSVNIAGGQTLTDGTAAYTGNNVSIPGGKTLRLLPTLDLSDNADNAEAISEAAAASAGGGLYRVTLSGRTLYKDGDWNTLCLPFALSAEQIAASPLAGATIMELDGTSSDLTNGTLTLNFNDAKEIKAGRPYIVKWPIGRVISSPSDWKSFAADVAGGNTYEGKTVRLAADIEVSEMAGTYTHPFKGTFDGQGHKLTVTLNNNDDSDKGTDEQYQGVAPFRFTSGATIMNLTVDGTVSTTNRKFAAGFIGWALESTNNIENCTSSVEICSTLNGDGTHGGFVGKASGTLNITNCLFNGMMTTSQTNGTNSCGGFVGWAATANTGVIIKNSLYAPATIPEGKYKIYDNNSAIFARNGANINKSYYTETFGTVQGTYAGGATGSALKNLLGDGWQVKDGKIVPVTTTIDIVNPVFTGVTIDDTDRPVTSKDGNVSFKGTYAPINWTVETPSILFVGEKNQLHWPLAGAHLNAFRAYFELDPNAHAREFVMNFDGGSEETGIISLSKEPRSQGEADAWYTVNGVKLDGRPTAKGMYIKNGKKVVIK